MRHLKFLLLLLIPIFSSSALAQSPVFGSCEQGGQTVSTQGLVSTTKVQRSFVSCTVTVFDTGTTTPSTIFSDSSSTPKANPFTASSAGLWSFYVNNGTYDVQLSAGGIASPFIIRTVKIADATTSGISGSGTSGKIVKWTSTSGVGNSIITDNGASIGINNTLPDASSLLDLTSISKGLLFPRMTTAQRDSIASPVAGLVIFNSTTAALNIYSSGVWSAVGGGGGTGTVTSVSLSLPSIFSITGSPITTSGTLTGTFATQTANTIFSGPALGGASSPTFRLLLKADLPSTTVFNDQSNTFSTGNQDFSSSTSLMVPASSGISPTLNSYIAYDTLANSLKYGSNGNTRTIVNTNEAQSLSNKTLITPVIADFTNALHSHQSSAGGGSLDVAAIGTGTFSIARGGTNSTVANYSTNGAFYFDGTKFITTATGGAGTLCLVSVAGGVPAFGSCAGSAATALSSMTAGVTSNSLNSGDNAQIWQWTLTTSGKTGWRLSENSASAAAGTPILIGIDTLSTSTVNPFQVTAGGTSNGIRVDTTGKLAKLGTGSVSADSLAGLAANGWLVQTSTGAFTARTFTAGTGVAITNPDGTGGAPSFSWSPSTQVSSYTTFDGSQASRTITYDLSGTDPVLTLSSSAFNISTGTLQQGGVAVVLPSTTDTFTNKTLTSSTNVIGGVTLTLGSDATGDIHYRNSSGIFTRLAIGATSKFLTVVGGLPAWSTPTYPNSAAVAGLYLVTDGTNVIAAAAPAIVTTITDAATLATNAALGNRFRATLGGNRTLGNPTNAVNGQQIVWELIQDGTGSRTITLDTKFALGTDITAVTLTTAINKRDFLTAVYNSTTDKFYVLGFIKGF